MARMTSPGLANLGSPAARERHLAERRNSAGGSRPARVRSAGSSIRRDPRRERCGRGRVVDARRAAGEPRRGRHDGLLVVRRGARGVVGDESARRRWGFGRDEKKTARQSRARADDHLLDVMKRGYREAEENGLGGGRDAQPYDPAKVDAETEYRTRSGRARLETKFIRPRALNFTEDTGRLRRLGRTLYLDGEPWLMRALCYSPIPVGWDPDWFEPYGGFLHVGVRGDIRTRHTAHRRRGREHAEDIHPQALAQALALLRPVPKVRYQRRGRVRVRGRDEVLLRYAAVDGGDQG